MFAKITKCLFFQTSIEFLGHIVREFEVTVDPKKLRVIQEWPQPATLKRLRGFLGLTDYYRKFVKGYAHIAHSLT